MIFECQQKAYDELSLLAKNVAKSIIICGPAGSGKTFLAKEYKKLTHFNNFIATTNKIQDIKTALYNIAENDTSVLCIENIRGREADVLLKILEEPTDNLIIVITTPNLYMLSQPIISRCHKVEINTLTPKDLITYRKAKYPDMDLESRVIWKGVNSFKNIDSCAQLYSKDVDCQSQYYKSIESDLKKTYSLKNCLWKLLRYPDNSTPDIELTLQYLVNTSKDSNVKLRCIKCLNNLHRKDMSESANLYSLIIGIKRFKNGA